MKLAVFISDPLLLHITVTKRLVAGGLSADNVRSWKIVRMWNFEDTLSTKDIISWHASKPEGAPWLLEVISTDTNHSWENQSVSTKKYFAPFHEVY